jgi:glycosyltransferase involved in cell wall biosynthesis
MKLLIQIPCFNEEKQLPATIAALPKRLPGITTIEYLVINDGSRDRTLAVARRLKVHHIVDMKTNQGLVNAFFAGLDACLSLGADIVVNTDADNQYQAGDIAKLIEPIVAGRAEIVIGERPIEEIPEFSWLKKKLQRLGSRVVSRAAGIAVPDTTSGFRAYSREGALRLNKLSDFTYTLVTVIQAGRKKIPLESVRIGVNPKMRESRLFHSIPNYIRRSFGTIFRLFLVYKPLKTFFTLGVLFLVPGIALGARFLYFFFSGSGKGHVQSLIFTAILVVSGFLLIVLGILADLTATNRRLLEDIKVRVKRLEYGDAPSTARRGRRV